MYCRVLQVSRGAFRKYLQNKDNPWKYEDLAEAMREIISEDECNDTYGRVRMYQALQLKAPEGVHIPSENTVRNVMAEIGLIHAKRRKPNGITKADRAARKSDDLLKRDFTSDEPLTKGVTDWLCLFELAENFHVLGTYEIGLRWRAGERFEDAEIY